MNNRCRTAAITGLGITEMTRGTGPSPVGLAIDACKQALQDADLRRAEIDGLLVGHSPIASCETLGIGLQRTLGLRDLALVQDVHGEGSTAGQIVHNATLYIGAGMVRNVLCVFADALLAPGVRAGDAFAVEVPYGYIRGWEAAHGMFGAVAAYGLAARRHMSLYGTSHDHFGAVARTARQWAGGNPMAVRCHPLSREEYDASPWVVEPFRKLDCAYPVNGGIALVISALDSTGTGPRAPVRIAGIGQGHRGNLFRKGENGEVRTGGVEAARAALAMARLTIDDVDVCELYDCFTYATIVTLEDYGFCPKGEGGPFVSDGCIAPGGRIPTSTGGGQLSGYYMQGMTPISEAVIQLRGDGGERQVPGAAVALVGTQGGIFDYHACMVLTGGDAA